MALGPVAEAFGVHEISRYSVGQSFTANGRDILPADSIAASPFSSPTASTLSLLMGQPGSFIESAPAAPLTAQAYGLQTLQKLGLLSGPDLSKYLAAHPDAVTDLLAAAPAASDVSLWWSNLDVQAKLNLRATAPQLLGNLEGVPFRIRDAANRTTLRITISDLNRVVDSTAGRSVVDNAKQQLKMLQSISDALDAVASDTAADQPRRTLLTLDVAGQGRAAIVLGDLATADYVTYLVPGMFFTIENQMGAWAEAAGGLYDQQLEWLDYFGTKDGVTKSSETVATVAWIGYHTPNLTNVGGIQNADEGRDALATAIKGLQSVRADDEPYVTVVAHSYGSTAALMALTEYDFEVDALALVGSPGSPAKSVDELHVTDGNVFVGEGAWDPIPNSSYFGSDPGSASYGAKIMGVSGGTDSITGETLLASNGHNEYFSPGTQSMRNFALISIGKGQYVSGGSPLLMVKAVGSGK
ncbi:alpha/beta hydrolase [Salinibacterium sp. G-O1]|uniref:alpha/beta hydrolase n=1 Tax=Salinibacterium sp. G-O1 TaxID=3046208 RepID=UPI0024B9B4BF|nr:alpha/beta hydrolase [Salinibacterium sp. G-O1]MDJ0335645.1 alpha/beta hydrolase [Salinibacterium sp. G-O1]